MELCLLRSVKKFEYWMEVLPNVNQRAPDIATFLRVSHITGPTSQTLDKKT